MSCSADSTCRTSLCSSTSNKCIACNPDSTLTGCGVGQTCSQETDTGKCWTTVCSTGTPCEWSNTTCNDDTAQCDTVECTSNTDCATSCKDDSNDSCTTICNTATGLCEACTFTGNDHSANDCPKDELTDPNSYYLCN
jgi:hypothetical protein